MGGRSSGGIARAARFVRRLAVDTAADLRGHDVPLAAAGLTFYAAVSLVPLLLVALWLAALVLGGAEIRQFAGTLGGIVGAQHGLDRAVRHITLAGTRAQLGALVTAVLISTLYGEGFTRALTRLTHRGAADPDRLVARRNRPHRSGGVLRGRLTAPLLVAASGVLVGGGLLITAWLSAALGSGDRATTLGVYLAFLVCWAGATANVALCYWVFGPQRPRPAPLLWAAAGAGSWIAGSALGFLLVLSLPASLGRPFAGSDALGTAVLLAFWLYFCHIAVLLGYAFALRLSAGPRPDADGSPPGAGDPAAVVAGPDRSDRQARLALRG